MSETTEAEFKICVDCRFSQLDNEKWICSHPSSYEQPPRSRVTGILPPAMQLSCWRARLIELTGFEHRCGADGRFWEPR